MIISVRVVERPCEAETGSVDAGAEREVESDVAEVGKKDQHGGSGQQVQALGQARQGGIRFGV